jgi:hypothetical protein
MEGADIVASYYIKNMTFDVVGYYDSDTPENEYDFFDVFAPAGNCDSDFLFSPEVTEDGKICINEGNPFFELPDRTDVMILANEYFK